jgi:hypothetical protein
MSDEQLFLLTPSFLIWGKIAEAVDYDIRAALVFMGSRSKFSHQYSLGR